MESNWAAEHLQTIRTLMERSALYRRALAPISIFAGVAGIAAAVLGAALKFDGAARFATYWMVVAGVAIAGSLFLVRRQAVKQGEVFWSPPLRRVAQAMFPALLVGFIFALAALVFMRQRPEAPAAMVFVLLWTILYGLALHAAGFFMPRGIRLFGWAFVIAGLVILGLMISNALWIVAVDCPNFVMGVVFGGFHLGYGIYLYFTERKNEA